MWKDTNNYNKIPLSVYREIHREAMNKFDELKSQSESILKKSYVAIGVIASIIVWLLGQVKISSIPQVLVLIIALSCVAIAAFFYLIISPHRTAIKGIEPSVFLEDENIFLFDNETKEKLIGDESEQVYYFNAIRIYEEKINKARLSLDKRLPKYKGILITTFAIFLITVVAFLSQFFCFHVV